MHIKNELSNVDLEPQVSSSAQVRPQSGSPLLPFFGRLHSSPQQSLIAVYFLRLKLSQVDDGANYGEVSYKYSSPFAHYPLLRLHSRCQPEHSQRDLVDLKSLKIATAIRHLDPSKEVCPFEVPGGGVCSDAGCDFVHLRRDEAGELLGEPSGAWWVVSLLWRG